MIIRLTLILAVGIAGSMVILGVEHQDTANAPIEKTVLNAAGKATGDLPVDNVVAASFDPTESTAPVVKLTPVIAPKRVVAPAPRPEVKLVRQETLDLTKIAPSEEAIEDAVVQAILPTADVRYVTGTRVNLRAGPSTLDDVVAQLARGTKAVVLDDGGGGWLQIRDLDTGVEGFMSGDFLSADAPG
jgi:uncharacterized protein YgiM (DUF1202 family)